MKKTQQVKQKDKQHKAQRANDRKAKAFKRYISY